jgi:hypothetical protein
MTDRDATIVDFYLYLAAALVTVRQLIQRARTRYRWDTRPTTKRLKLHLLPGALSSECLDDLFADRSIIAGLRALNSRVALVLAAFTPERAGVVRRLNDEGVPVVAILCVPRMSSTAVTSRVALPVVRP